MKELSETLNRAIDDISLEDADKIFAAFCLGTKIQLAVDMAIVREQNELEGDKARAGLLEYCRSIALGDITTIQSASDDILEFGQGLKRDLEVEDIEDKMVQSNRMQRAVERFCAVMLGEINDNTPD